MITVTKEQIENWNKGTTSMAQACANSGLHPTTFKRHAMKYGLYIPNQGAKGSSKSKREGAGKTPLNEILEGLHPQYQSYKLKHKLYDAGLKENKCEECELDRIDGD